ncbi:MAG: hypothetical protein OHK0022_27720 [Roseiflexaceae bacterium]
MTDTQQQQLIAWGHNPGQAAVKDTFDTAGGKRGETTPYPAVIAPWERSDDIGLSSSASRAPVLEAVVGGARYLGGTKAARMPGAIRQMANGRLHEDSPVYPAFAQMSLAHTRLGQRLTEEAPAQLVIATALPVGWRTEDAQGAIERHIRTGLRGRAQIRMVYVRSEPSAVVYHELLLDDGSIRSDQQDLVKSLVCVADIGGSTLNRAVLERIEALPGQSESPLLGSRRAIDRLMSQADMSFVDAEARLRAAVEQPGSDPAADLILRQYAEAVVAELQQAWNIYKPAAYLFAGGTVLWVADALRRAFGPKARIVEKPQQAIATGLWRYARMKIARGLR